MPVQLDPGELSDSKVARFIKNRMYKTYRHTPNLWLRVTKNGAWWVFRYKLRGPGHKPRSMGLGSISDFNCERAAERARECRRLLKAGKDPMAERDAEKLQAKIDAGREKTVSQVAEEWFEAMMADKRKATQESARFFIRKYINPSIGDWPIKKVDAGVLLNHVGLARLWKEKYRTARTLQVYLLGIFKFAKITKCYPYENPAIWKDNLEGVLSRRDDYEVKSRIDLPYKQLAKFLQDCRSYKDRRAIELKTNTPCLIEFVVLTGARPSEVAKAKWSEMNLDAMVWTCPWKHLKYGNKHHRDKERPITPPMKAVLDEMKQRHGDAPNAFVFPGLIKGKPLTKRAWAGFIKNNLKYDCHLHGFRTTLRKWMRANRRPEYLWSIQVDHAHGYKTARSYEGQDRQELEELERRRDVMTKYGEYCERPAPEPNSEGSNVVNMADRRIAS
jgi:integrase